MFLKKIIVIIFVLQYYKSYFSPELKEIKIAALSV